MMNLTHFGTAGEFRIQKSEASRKSCRVEACGLRALAHGADTHAIRLEN